MRTEKEVVVVTTKRITPKNATKEKQTRVFESDQLANEWIESHNADLSDHQQMHTTHDTRSVAYFSE